MGRIYETTFGLGWRTLGATALLVLPACGADDGRGGDGAALTLTGGSAGEATTGDAGDDVGVGSEGAEGTGAADAAGGCGAMVGVDAAGHCATACGAATACDGLDPGDALGSCQAAGASAVGDVCDATCQIADDPQNLCRAGDDCTGAPQCDGMAQGSDDCDADCGWVGACDEPGVVNVYLDDVPVFTDEPAARSLVCDQMQFVEGWGCGSGPPTAQVDVVVDDPGHFEADLSGFTEEHGNCEEKWCFLRLRGQCSEIMLEKWNWAECNTEYHTDEMKLEIWVDQNGDCEYQGEENWEPYGGHVTWDPAQVYRVRIEYT